MQRSRAFHLMHFPDFLSARRRQMNTTVIASSQVAASAIASLSLAVAGARNPLHKLAEALRCTLACAALAMFASAASAAVPTPTVIGPLASDTPGSASRNYPFF